MAEIFPSLAKDENLQFQGEQIRNRVNPNNSIVEKWYATYMGTPIRIIIALSPGTVETGRKWYNGLLVLSEKKKKTGMHKFYIRWKYSSGMKGKEKHFQMNENKENLLQENLSEEWLHW